MYAKLKAPAFDGTQPCRRLELEDFFPVDRIEEAKMREKSRAVCGSCKFQAECLEWALTNREIGIWAGTTDEDRRLILRRRRRK